MTPREWLIELPETLTATVLATLESLVSPTGAVLTDLSDGLAGFVVAGARAADVLMTGCSLDLRAEAFRIGQSARTLLAEIPASLYACGPTPAIRCLVERPFAEHFWNWLAESPARW
jgi:sarcosine oxidase subunit gamma